MFPGYRMKFSFTIENKEGIEYVQAYPTTVHTVDYNKPEAFDELIQDVLKAKEQFISINSLIKE